MRERNVYKCVCVCACVQLTRGKWDTGRGLKMLEGICVNTINLHLHNNSHVLAEGKTHKHTQTEYVSVLYINSTLSH